MKYHKVKLQLNTVYVTTLPQTSGVLYDLKFSNDINKEYYALIQSVWFSNWVCLFPWLLTLNCLQQIIYDTKMSNILRATCTSHVGLPLFFYMAHDVFGGKRQLILILTLCRTQGDQVCSWSCFPFPEHITGSFGRVTPMCFDCFKLIWQKSG